MRRPWAITKRTVVSFYDDQMTQHAAAITYYSLMSLFPAILLALSILGLVGEYPRTYDAIVRYLNDVAPPSVVRPIDESLRDAFRNKSTATTGLFLSIFLAFFGTTGVLESMRRALNVVFEVDSGRSFFRRKLVDVFSTFALLALVLSTLIFVVVGRGLAEELLRLVGADENAAAVWSVLRWPAAVASALLGFSFVYYVTPDLKHKAFHLVTPGAALGVVAWLLVSYGLSEYISNVVNIGALYGAFTGAIVVVLWLWFSSCSLLLGAELNAAITRQRMLEAADEGAGAADGGNSEGPPVEGERDERRTRWRRRRRARAAARAADAPGSSATGVADEPYVDGGPPAGDEGAGRSDAPEDRDADPS
ncbi:YihY/virulence factor BrkB family protein, partial [Patulibacter sp.]|uniref:YihY/virulence factor BrkB family protein n=1 Tax=Patulibacter sp. TaxID=1912859 RepID=UPI0027291563